MHLLIRAVSLAGQPLTQAISAYFDERGGTIGRSDTNTLALPDPERRISRLQAEVSRSPDGWRLLNVGNANPIWHNNRAIPPGEGALLDENDELQIGTYALQVTYSQNDATARTITKGRAAVDSRTVIVGSGQEPRTDSSLMHASERSAIQTPSMAAPVSAPAPAPAPAPVAQPAVSHVAAPATAATPAATPASPFADLLGGFGSGSSSPAFAQPAAPSSGSPFADLLGTPAPMSSSPSPSPFDFGGAPFAPAPAPAFTPAPAQAAAPSRLPDDFDPFADFQAAPAPAGRPAAPSGSWDLPKSPAAASANPFDLNPGAPALPGDLDLMGSVAPAGANSIDQLFGLGGGTSSDPLASFLKKTEPAAPAEAAAGTPSNVDPLALIAPRADVVVAPAGPESADAGGAFPDDVPELQAAMVLPAVAPAVEVKAEPAAAPREHMAASFSFMPPPAASPKPSAPKADAFAEAPEPTATPAPVSGLASPFADLGLGASGTKSALLDDLDLSPQTVPSVRVPSAEQAASAPVSSDDLLGLDMSLPVGHAPLQAPLETQLPTPQTAVPHVAVHQPTSVPDDEAPTNVPLATTPVPQVAAAPVATSLAAVGAAPAADTQALWAAFCEGAGIHFTPPQGLNPDLMRVIGQLLHHTVDGSLKLVAARAATKQEMRAEVTVIQARRNNPLKFSPDTQSAMEQLLQPPMRGFMTGPEAVADAMDDLLGHTIGTMVGMRAALEGVLARFEPEQLETKLVGRSMLDSLLPMNRRAKLWELYLQHYEAVKTEAQDDFHNLFGRAFLQAYEEQLDRLDAERRQSGRHPAAPIPPSA